MTINKVDKKARMSRVEVIRYQIITHCFLAGIDLSEAELGLLTLLSIEGESDLGAFCTLCQDQKIYKSAQTARNAIGKAEKKKLIEKTGDIKKRIRIHQDLKLVTTGNILLDYKFLYTESK